MSLREVTMWRVVCDWPGCTASAQDDTEHYAWSDRQTALDDVVYADWWESADETSHYCTGHPAEWASDHENSEPYPAPPYLLIDDGHARLVAVAA
jgi:hypothetical protein